MDAPRTRPNPRDYIQTAATGNALSRRAAIYGASNIVLGGKCIVEHRAILRGDLQRTVRADGDERASAVVIAMGRYGHVGEHAVLRPPHKTYKGYVVRLTQSLFLLSAAPRRPRHDRRTDRSRGGANRQPCRDRRRLCARTSLF